MIRILEELSLRVLGEADPAAVRSAVERARMEEVSATAPGALHLWQRAAAELGMRLELARGSLLDISRQRVPLALPVVVMGDALDSPALLITQATAGHLWILDASLEAPTRTPIKDVAGRLGVLPDAPLNLAAAHALLPLAPLAGQGPTLAGDGHAHHAHHGPPPAARLWGLLRTERESLVTAVIYGAGVGLLSLAIPVAVQAFVTTVAFGTMLQPLLVLGLMLAVGLAFAALLRALQAVAVEMVQRRLFARAALDLAHRFGRLAPQERTAHHAPELLNRFFDVMTLQKGLAVLTVDGVQLVLQLILGMALLAFYHPILLAFDLLLGLGVLVVLRPLGLGAVESAMAESAAKYRVAAWLQEVGRHGDLFSSSSAARFAVVRVEELAAQYLAHRHHHWRALFRQVVGSLALGVLANVALLTVGGWLVMQKQLTLGQLIAAELVVSGLVASLMKMGKYLETWYDVLAGCGKLGHLMELALEPADGVEPPRDGLTLKVPQPAGAVLAPAPGARLLLQEQQPGAAAALLEAVSGRRPAQGITLAGMDVRDLQRGALRDGVVLLRCVEIFEGSLEDNLLLGHCERAPQEVRAILDDVGLAAELAALPRGLKTPLNTHGAPLSPQGRIQLAVARALVRHPALLLVDLPLDTLPRAARTRVLAALANPAHAGVVLLHQPFAQAVPGFVATPVDNIPALPVGDTHAH